MDKDDTVTGWSQYLGKKCIKFKEISQKFRSSQNTSKVVTDITIARQEGEIAT
jgi:hypothetical protein